MSTLLLGITLTVWALILLGLVAISNEILGILALVTGIVYIASSIGVAIPQLPARRRNQD